MWLLKTETLELEEFHKDIPQYAILSHRWEDKQEVSFQNIHESPDHLSGYHKVKSFCQVALQEGYSYVWVDTCCIDKKSSAELSEAINSMYKWYRQAAVCYAYLSDVDTKEDISKSLWFTRGWTLQELLAPTVLFFFNRDWVFLASRKVLKATLGTITGISREAFNVFKADNFSIAQRMSWSARRTTTREEDRAYCLMGIFDVNMPLLYGEGKRAFQRLQEEIMRSSNDLSLFLWQGRSCDNFGMLASDPSCFSNVSNHDIYPKMSKGWDVNNAGIRLTTTILPYAITRQFRRIFLLYLQEPSQKKWSSGPAIFIEQESGGKDDSSYHRVSINGEVWSKEGLASHRSNTQYNSCPSRLFISRQLLGARQVDGCHTFQINFRSARPCRSVCRQRPSSGQAVFCKDWPVIEETALGSLNCCFTFPSNNADGILSHVVFTVVDEVDLLVCLGFDHLFRPIVVVVPFCKHIYYGDLIAWDILRAYDKLRSCATRGNVFLDPPSLISAVQGSEEILGHRGLTTGLFLEIREQKGTQGDYKASIYFDHDAFLRQHIPGLRDDTDLVWNHVSLGPAEYNTAIENALSPMLRVDSAFHKSQRDFLKPRVDVEAYSEFKTDVVLRQHGL